jgi:hypothetical protein
MAVSAISLLAASTAAGSAPTRPSTVSCDPDRGVARIVGAAGDYATVGYRVDDNALLLDNLIAINSQGDTHHDRITCVNADGGWRRVSLALGSGKDTSNPRGDAPEFAAVPAEIEMRINGGRQIDDLSGHKGPDIINGGRGRDYINGFDGDDRLVGGRGDDEIGGQAGDDFIDSVDGIRDQVLCGKGDDTAVADPEDRPKDCETVRSRSPSERR